MNPHDACLNCGERFATSAPRPRFCPACGQETNIRPPRVGEFIQQFGGAYLATEGALWRTLALLVFKPGELTRRYLAGRRKHYVLPLRLYLTLSVVVLLALRLATEAGMQEAAVKIEAPANGRVDLVFGRAGLRDGHFYCDNMPAWVCKRLQRRLVASPDEMKRQMLEVGERFIGSLGAAMFVLLPAFALMLKTLYWNRRLRYTEHLVFALHLHAFAFIALAFTLPDRQWLSALAFAAVPIYGMRAMKVVYGGAWWKRLLRALVLALMYLMALALVMTVLALWALLS